jgi:hypothetical protein
MVHSDAGAIYLIHKLGNDMRGGPSMFFALVLIERDQQMCRDALRGYPKAQGVDGGSAPTRRIAQTTGRG